MRSFARCVCALVCVRAHMCVREGDTVTTAACVQTHTSFITVCHATLFPFWAWTDANAKTKDIINLFISKAKARDYGKGRNISDAACGVWPITMHCDSWQIRADCACRKEELCRKQSVWERRGIEDLQ